MVPRRDSRLGFFMEAFLPFFAFWVILPEFTGENAKPDKVFDWKYYLCYNVHDASSDKAYTLRGRVPQFGEDRAKLPGDCVIMYIAWTGCLSEMPCGLCTR